MLGSRKLLIFGIVSALVLSLLVVGAFAEDRVSNEPMFRSISAPTFTFTTSADVLNQIYVYLSDNGYTSSSNALATSDLYNITIGAYITSLYAQGNIVYQVFNGQAHESARDRVWGFDEFSTLDFFVNEVGINASVFNSTGGDFVLGGVLPLFESITAIGSSLVAFVIARPIVLIPIVAMILVLSYGVIRRLIKGV